MDALTEATRDKHDGTRIQAIAALGGIGPEAKKAAPALLDTLKVKHVETQARAAAALLAIEASSDEKLAAAIREINRTVRWATPPVLVQFGRKPKDAVRPLMLALKDDDPNQRAAAAVALGNIGRDAKEAVPALKKALDDLDVRVRLSAAGALPLIDDAMHKQAAQAFTQMLPALEKREFVLLGLIQAKQALIQAQVQAVLADPRVQAQLAKQQQAVLMAALADPDLQAYYLEITWNFITAMSTVPPKNCGKLYDFQVQARDALLSLGPDGIRALVAGVNAIAAFRLGFC
jgi:HEAT repeat protein